MNITPEIDKAIRVYAEMTELPAMLVSAMVLTESGGDQWAWNPEPHYRYLVDATTGAPFRRLTADEIRSQVPPKDFPSMPGLADDRDAEWWGQQASWGLMQVMGAVAREYGFKQHFPALCDVHTGLQYGCRHLGRLRDRFLERHGWEGVVAAYNAGSPRRDSLGWVNQGYVDKVRAHGGFGFQESQ